MQNILYKIALWVDRNRWFLLVWGGICAFMFVVPWINYEGATPDWRIERIQIYYEALMADGKFDFSYATHTMGYPLYFPFIMKYTGIADAKLVMFCAQSWSAALIIFFYPLLMKKIFNSNIIALIAPVFIRFTFGDCLYIVKTAEYSFSLIVLVATLPLVYLLLLEYRPANIVLWVGLIAAIISAGNAMRAHSGAPVAFVVVVILLIKTIKKNMKIKLFIISFVIITASYNLLGTTIPDIVAKKWGYDGKNMYNVSAWGELLYGMAYVENDYGLELSDQSVRDIMKRYYPDVEFLSKEYSDCQRDLYFKIICESPLFFIKGIILKFLECIKLQLQYLWSNKIYVAMITFIFLFNIVKFVKKWKIEYGTKYLLPLLGIFLTTLYLYPGILVWPLSRFFLAGYAGIGVVVMSLFFVECKAAINMAVWEKADKSLCNSNI